ncbi:hypothetical protein PORY_001319 [Pneumocystis oryctolagi]|uniref:Uncharacterized protein n=1 Tax=Pneumocystis oryctolagi TaxID=42067 RepID=A0ACB7CI17_9ASCO|nr:hypothetical protein PORY_001319 [Pneumocystis oryctolagi]
MRWSAVLAVELSRLAAEAKRKYPELRTAAEQSLADLKGFQADAAERIRQCPGFLAPFLLGCGTQSAKCCAIAVGCLQRLMVVGAVAKSSVPSVLEALGEAALLSAEIQLKILQMLPVLMTNYACVLTGVHLGEVFRICFVLQSSKYSVVQNTAAATLRQLVMLVFERATGCCSKSVECGVLVAPAQEEAGAEKTQEVHQALADAYHLVEDLCLLVNGEKPKMLPVHRLHKTFGLELIESVLTSHPVIFQKVPFLLASHMKLLRNLIFLVLRPFSHKSDFAVTVRSARIIYLLLRQHLKNLIVEGEVAFNSFCHVLVDPQDNGWLRVLVMEIFRGICADSSLIRMIYEYYDAEASRKNILYEIVFSFNKLAREQPGLIGLSMNVIFKTSDNNAYDGTYEILGNITDMFGGVSRTFTDQCPPGIDSKTSMIRISFIDQLDKTEPPIIPPTYVYYLILTCLNSIADGIAKTVIPFFKRSSSRKSVESKTPNKTNDALSPQLKKSEQLSSSILSELLHTEHKEVFICSKIIEHMWPAFLAAFSTFLSASMSTDLFYNLIRSYRRFTQASAYLGYNISRNAFLTNISKLSVPPIFIIPYNALQSSFSTNNQSKSQLSIDDHVTNNVSDIINSCLPHDPDNVMMLTQKNLICLRAILLLSIHLGNNLNSSWSIILETLQKVELTVLEMSRKNPIKFPYNILSTQVSSNIDKKEDIALLSGKSSLNIDILSMHALINIAFENTKTFSDKSLLDVLKTICELVVFSESSENNSPSETKIFFDVKKNISSTNFYNYPGFPIFNKSDELAFVFHKINLICKINIERLFFGASEKNGWDVVISYLYSFIQSRKVDSLIRKQASEIFLDIIKAVITSHCWKNLEDSDKALRKILSIINLLSIKNIIKDTDVQLYYNDRTVELEIISMLFDVLNLLLNSLGHLISESWDIVFQMINSVFDDDLPVSISFEKDHSDILFYKKKEYKELLRIPKILKDAFFSLQLICTDFLSELSMGFFLTLISTLRKFCLQKDDLNISLTAIGLFWNISDSLRSKTSFEGTTQTFDDNSELTFLMELKDNVSVQDSLWIVLLFRLTEVMLNDRSEVRNGAIQTVFRNFDAYEENIKDNLWKYCFQIIIYRIFFMFEKNASENINNCEIDDLFKNIDKDSFEESLILVISGLMSLFCRNFESFLSLEIFFEIWDKLLNFFARSAKCSSEIFMHCCKAIGNILDKMESIELGLNRNNLYTKIWLVWNSFSDIVSPNYDESLFENQTLSQEALNKFVNFTQSLYKFIIPNNDLSLINRLIESTFNALVYSQCPTYYLDIDFMTPLQSSVLEMVDLLKDNNEQTCVLCLKQLAKISKLAFDKDLLTITLANQNLSKINKIFSTYIAISKSSFERMEQYFLKYSENVLVYEQNAFFEIIQALSVPIKLKHKCPSTSRISNGEPFWKFATLKMLSILEKSDFKMSLPSSNVELWEIINDCLHEILLFNYNDDNSIFLKESDEDFDISTYIRLRDILFPLIGNNIKILEKIVYIIAKSSFVYNCSEQILAFEELSSFSTIPELELKKYTFKKIVPQREKLGFICLNDLFDFCSIKPDDDTLERRSIAVITGKYLLKRCSIVLQQFILNHQMRGCIPMSRIERAELITIIQNLNNTEFYSNMNEFDNNLENNSQAPGNLETLTMQIFPLLCIALPYCYQDLELLKLISLFFQKISKSIHIYQAFI